MEYPHPTKAQILAAKDKRVPDIIGPGLKVLFCGINPGLYSAAVGHHFGRPGNRFWKALFGAGFTPRLLSPCEDRTLLSYGYGITNLVSRATASADELSRAELSAGRTSLVRKVRRYRPKAVAVLGVSAFRTAFDRPYAAAGLQTETIGGTLLWVLPNPSGLNANYQIADLIRLFRELHTAV